MKKILFFLAIAALAVVIKVTTFGGGGAVGKSAVKAYHESEESDRIDYHLAQMMNMINKQAPVMVDKDTRLDNAWGLAHQFRYNYTLIDHDGAEVSGQQFTKAMLPYLHNEVCEGKTLKVLPENGVTVSFAYKGRDGADIATITITPAECRSSASM
jgi:hypothetical protein